MYVCLENWIKWRKGLVKTEYVHCHPSWPGERQSLDAEIQVSLWELRARSVTEGVGALNPISYGGAIGPPLGFTGRKLKIGLARRAKLLRL